jgi:hypothetical protein
LAGEVKAPCVVTTTKVISLAFPSLPTYRMEALLRHPPATDTVLPAALKSRWPSVLALEAGMASK